jgi:DNA-binding response OmpR family regulator
MSDAKIVDRGASSVLVVDDHAATKYSVARTLRAKGYKTVEAATGAEALELAEFVSAVVLDVNLPDVNGFEVCKILRGRPSTALLPIIHMSARGISEASSGASLSGSDCFLPSPLDPHALVLAVDELIARNTRLRGYEPRQMEPGVRSGNGARSVRDQMTRRENK